MKHQYKPKKCQFIEHRDLVLDTKSGEPKLDKKGNVIPIVENRTAVCKLNPKSIDPRFFAAFDASKDTINSILEMMSEHWFDVYTVESKVKTDMKKFSLMDLYAGIVPKEVLSGIYTLIHGRNRVLVTKMITGRTTREVMAPQENDKFILCNREDFITPLKKKIDKIFGAETTIPAKWWDETICGDVDIMMKSYAQRVLGTDDSNDNKWLHAVHEASENLYKSESDRKYDERIIIEVGPQHLRYVNGLTPDTTVRSWPLACKICGENKSIEEPDFKKDKKLAKLYNATMKCFENAIREAFPKKMVFKPNIPVMEKSSIKKIDGYYNYSAELSCLPGPKGANRFRIEFRAQSDHSGAEYYPTDIFKYAAGEMTPRISRLKSTDELTLNIPYKVPCKIPVMKPDAEINWKSGIGIDIGYARFGMILSKPAVEFPGMVNWNEALSWFADQYGKVVLTRHLSKSTCKDLDGMLEEERIGKTNMGAIFLLGVRDGNPPDVEHEWRPSHDPLAPLFTRMVRRTNKDGSPFYSNRQLEIIGYTKTFRIQMRQVFANRLEYYHLQSKWDLTHTPEHVFAKESEDAKRLSDRYDFLNKSIRCITQRFVSDILTSDGAFKPAFISMEDLNLNNLDKDTKFKSLYSTITRDWHIDPRNEYKVSIRQGRTVAEITYPDGVKPPKPAQFKKVFPATEQWNTPVRLSANGQTIVIACTPTSVGMAAMAHDSIEYYTKKALHVALIKHDVERMCTRMGILYREISAKFTSQTCDCCGYVKSTTYNPKENGCDIEASIERAKTENKNFRYGRTFICGNPLCPMCGVTVNADNNASSVICHKVRNGSSDYFKEKREKFKLMKVKNNAKMSCKLKTCK